jgi:peptidyl-prolyl cis-trans isomerase C
MKTCCIALLLVTPCVWAQTTPAQTPAQSAPARKSPTPAPVPHTETATPAPAPAEIKPETVVANLNGKPFSVSDFQKVIETLPPANKAAAMREPAKFFEEYALFQKILEVAEKDKLDQQSPYKERLADMRKQLLVNAEVNEAGTKVRVEPEQQQKYFETHKEKYIETKAKLIFLPFSASPAANPDPKGAKSMTEAEAKLRADQLVKEARAGADFGKLARENSKDPGTVQRDGDIGVGIRPSSSQVPDVLRNPIVALKKGEVSDPVKTDNGFYVFKAESVSALPYEQVKDEIYKELKDEGLRKWLDETKKQSSFKIENEEYFKRGTAGQ